MAFDYDTNPTGVFFRSGKLVKYLNAHAVDATTTYPAELKAIADPYELADETDQIDRLYDFFAQQKNNTRSYRQGLARFVDGTFLDRDSVLEQLGVVNGTLASVLTALRAQMVIDGKTVKKCTVTLGSTTAASGNVGNGTVLTTKLLDGFNAPLAGGLALPGYAGLNSELAVTSETMNVICTQDSQRDGTQEGSEQFSWSGGVPSPVFDWQDEGSGQGPGIRAAGGTSLIQGGDFETWTSNVPSGWTIDSGTAGTHIFQETGAANVYRGTSSLKFLGNGALATHQISQAINPAILRAKRCYCVPVRLKASGVPASGTINILFAGTGYTASASEKVSIAAASFPVAYTLYNFFIVLPSIIPADWKLVVSVTGTLSNAVSLYVDSVLPVEVPYHGGIGAVVVPGSTRFVAGDKLSWTVANDNAGVWQTYSRRWWKVQFSSATAGSETLSDTLAT